MTSIKIVFEGDATLLRAMVQGVNLDLVNAMMGPHIKGVKITEISLLEDSDYKLPQINGNPVPG